VESLEKRGHHGATTANAAIDRAALRDPLKLVAGLPSGEAAHAAVHGAADAESPDSRCVDRWSRIC